MIEQKLCIYAKMHSFFIFSVLKKQKKSDKILTIINGAD